jgi:hypothetical protein
MTEDRTHFYGDGCCVEPGDSDAKLGENSLVDQARRLCAAATPGMVRVLAGLADEVERLEAALKNIALARCLGNTVPPGCSGTCVTCEARAALEGTTSEVRVGAIAGLQARVAALEAFAQRFVNVGFEFGDPTQLIDLHDEARALLDAGQHHRDDGCLDEVVRLSADAGLYDDLCKTCGEPNSEHGAP